MPRRRVIQAYWLSTLFVLLSILLISACGGGDKSTPTSVPAGEGNSEAGSPDSGATKLPEATQATPSIAQATPTTEPTGSFGSDAGTLSLNDALGRTIELYGSLVDVLAGVTDEDTAEAAARDLSDILTEFQALESQLDNYSDAEIANAALSATFFDFGQRFSGEVTRIMLNPDTASVLAAAFSEFESSGSAEVESGSTSTQIPSLIPGAGSIPFGDPAEALNLSFRLGFSFLPSSIQQCFRDGFNSLQLDFDSWQRAEFDLTLDQYNELGVTCDLAQ